MIELQRVPTHPGEVLKEDFLEPLEITQTKLADALHTSFRAINELVNQKRGITVEMAIKLSKYFNTSPQIWLNLQNNYDLYKVLQKKKDLIESIHSFKDVA